MINGSNIRLPNGQFSTLVTPVDKDGVTQFVTPVDFNGNIVTGGGAPSNGFVVNNVANFYQSTKPLTRADGSALVANDIWRDTSTNTSWFWNGTYWLSAEPQVYTVESRGGIANAGGTFFSNQCLRNSGTGTFQFGTFCEYWAYFFTISGTRDASNYYTLRPRFRQASTSEMPWGTLSPNLFAINNFGIITENFLLLNSTSPVNNLGITLAVGAGSPTAPQNLVVSFFCRWVAP